jgi:pimeloyl-ACP methyl ester carboxylesterase
MEKLIKIQQGNAPSSYGSLTKTGSSRLIILIHGLGGHYNDQLFIQGSRHFSMHGFDCFRLDLYRGNRSASRLSKTTIRTQATDFSAIVDYFHAAYTELHIVAHSLGCSTVLMSNKLSGATSLTLWEPARQPQDMLQDVCYNSKLHLFEIAGWPGSIVDEQVIEDLATIPPISILLQTINPPILIIGAGRAGYRVARDLYFRSAREPKMFWNIRYADHNFSEERAQNDLFAHTLMWLQGHPWRNN